ncbi:hypothetical protein KY358_06450 [Candidatus Woesearchaeota archaeon]|nr:hypothetical protein [Candidatus Woesearchaeota archaeon]
MFGEECKNLFFTSNNPNGYEMVFGAQFVSAGALMVYGKFKGFKNIP